MPIAVIGSQPVGGLVDVIHVDEQRAAGLIVQELTAAGMTTLIQLAAAPDENDDAVRVRQQALRDSAAANGLEYRQGSSVAEATALARSCARCGIVAHNDLRAIYLISSLQGAGLRPGKDLPVLSYDNTYLAERPEFDLSSIDQHAGEMADRALGLLVSRIGDATAPGREIVLEPRLVVRGSSVG
jgi:DNA-binding LacI/PurR family transcriptional regulator